jgi:DNA-binding FadR family transcriptional regulator
MSDMNTILRSADPVRAFLSSEVGAGRVQAGHRLPTERALAERLRCTRGTVRKSLALLEAEGKLVRRVGDGTYLAAWMDDVHGTSPAQIMEARLVLEPGLAAAAAGCATPADLAELDRWAALGEGARDPAGFEAADSQLHLAIARAARNTLLVQAYGLVAQARQVEEWRSLKLQRHNPKRRGEVRAEHKAVLQAIRARDPDAAAMAMEAHLLSVRRNLLGI